MFKGRHDLKFGFGWRKASVTSESGWPGNGVRTYHRGYPNMQARVVRDWSLSGEGQVLERLPRRHDQLRPADGERRRALGSRPPARCRRRRSPPARRCPELLPALDAPAVDNAIVYNNVTPRVGFTYALDESRKTIVRGSYAAFASQLDSNRAALTVSAIPYYSYVYYAAVDTNGNRIADVSEFTTFQGVAGFDPDNPARRQPGPHRQLQLAADPRAAVRRRARAVQELRRGGQRDVAALHRLQLAELSRRHRRGLHPGRRLQRHRTGGRHLQRAVLPRQRRARCRTTSGRSTRRVPTTTSAISGSRSPPPSAWPTSG